MTRLSSKKYYPYYLFFGIAFFLTFMFYRQVPSDSLLMVGDTFYKLSYAEVATNALEIRKIDSLGTHNGWQHMTQFWDTLYFLFIYKIGFHAWWADFFRYMLVIFFSLTFAFIGIKRLNRLYAVNATEISLIFVVLWYIFNPYTFTLFHGGVYNFGSGLTYSLTPLILYTFHCAFLRNKTERTKSAVLWAILLACASFTFWLTAALLFFLVIYFMIMVVIQRQEFFTKDNLVSLGKTTLVSGVIYFLLISPIIFALVFEFINKTGFKNPFDSPTFGNQQGGLLYQFMLIFSWGIYTEWFPRHIYSFGKFFFSVPYQISLGLLYGVILLGLFKAKKHSKKYIKFFLGFVGILFIFVFFAKAGQPPLGEIFYYLYDKVPLFRVFRSADARFGYLVVLALSLLLLLSSRFIKVAKFSIALTIVLVIQNYYLLTGVAITGEEIPEKYFDRIVHVSADLSEIKNYLNAQPEPYSGYVFVLPSLEYGHYLIDTNEHFVGNDLAAAVITKPFLYPSVALTGLNLESHQKLQEIIETNDFEQLSLFPIEYILLRRDAICQDCSNKDEAVLDSYFKQVIRNDTYTLYKNPTFEPLVTGTDLSFEYVSPTKILVQTYDQAVPQKINLKLSYDKHWKISPRIGTNNKILYYNSWTVPAEGATYILYYEPQLYFMSLLMVSAITLVFSISLYHRVKT